MNSGLANSAGTAYSSGQQAIGLGYAEFLLLTASDYTKNGGSNNPWCAIYVGPAPSIGTRRAAAWASAAESADRASVCSG